MSERCEEFGPLLVAWMYDDVDAGEAAAVEEHLQECAGCRHRRDAYLGVRGDLQEWQPAETPRTITFIGTPAAARERSGWLSWTAPAAAVAASFVLGLGLTAAAVNLQVQHDGDGWTLTTGLFGTPTLAETDPATSSEAAAEPGAGSPDAATTTSPGTPAATGGEPGGSAAPAGETQTPRITGTTPRGAGTAGPRPVSLGPAERRVLASWLDQELAARGLETIPAEPAESHLTDAERQQIHRLVSEALSRQEAAYRMYLNDLVSAMETRQREQMASTLTSIYENLEAERRDAIFMLASQLGLLEVNHGEELALTNAKLDYLLSQMTPPSNGEPNRQENR